MTCCCILKISVSLETSRPNAFSDLQHVRVFGRMLRGVRDTLSVLESAKVAYVCHFCASSHVHCCIHDHVSCLQRHVAPCPLGAETVRTSRTKHIFWNPQVAPFQLQAKMIVLRQWELDSGKNGAPASARCILFEGWIPAPNFSSLVKMPPDCPNIAPKWPQDRLR